MIRANVMEDQEAIMLTIFSAFILRLGLFYEITGRWESSSLAKWETHWDGIPCTDS